MTVNTASCRRGPQQCLQSVAPMRELTAHMHGPSAQAGPGLNHCASKHSTQTPSRNPTHLYTHFKINMHTGRAPAEPGEAPLKFCGWTLPAPHRLQLGNFQQVQLLRASYLPCGSSCHTNTILRSQPKFSSSKGMHKLLNSARRMRRPPFAASLLETLLSKTWHSLLTLPRLPSPHGSKRQTLPAPQLYLFIYF